MSTRRGAPPQVGVGYANLIMRPTTQPTNTHNASEAAE